MRVRARTLARLAFALLLVAGWLSANCGAGIAEVHAAAGGGPLTSCTFGALSAAVAKHGTIDFGCAGTITFSAPITVSSAATTIDAAGNRSSSTAAAQPSCSRSTAARSR
ncbi:MAG TPA: hypothetical protein VME70_14050 [Mycobacteriales bacterium]|nr:hypothetical protein [Mycobacteriales bacterium]